MSEITEGFDRDAAQARSDAATPGPWFVDRGGEVDAPFWQIPDVLRDRYGNNSISSNDQATIEFMAHARTDLPAALDEITALRGEVERLSDENKLLRAECEKLQWVPMAQRAVKAEAERGALRTALDRVNEMCDEADRLWRRASSGQGTGKLDASRVRAAATVTPPEVQQ